MNIRVGILTAPHIDFIQKTNSFMLKNVRIGIGFHWDRCEDQEFAGTLSILKNSDNTETAVNTIDLEDYLCSVISSEMNADSPMELLKAHAVISRSWAIRAIEANHSQQQNIEMNGKAFTYESNGHIGFDVCADDHCQRYEGLARMNERAVAAVHATKGQVLTYQNEICDCRFSKCCGGMTEQFETCWEDKHVPYLVSVPCPYCDTHDEKILRTVLNSYDQETQDFHDWTVQYSAQEIHDLIEEHTGRDLGEIQELRPLLRGTSGRIYSLEVIGSKNTIILGKELKIRRTLSRSCLYSSWFDVEKKLSSNNPSSTEFILHGHGWGHGVGLCQIGAAVMASQHFTYQEILEHYYPNTLLISI